MLVKRIPSATCRVVVGEDAAGCVAESVVALEEGVGGCSVAPSTLSEGFSQEGTSSDH